MADKIATNIVGDPGVETPVALAYDHSGRMLYIADYSAGTICAYYFGTQAHPQGKQVLALRYMQQTFSFTHPIGLALDEARQILYVAEGGGGSSGGSGSSQCPDLVKAWGCGEPISSNHFPPGNQGAKGAEECSDVCRSLSQS